jgi:hypothetical protein
VPLVPLAIVTQTAPVVAVHAHVAAEDETVIVPLPASLENARLAGSIV